MRRRGFTLSRRLVVPALVPALALSSGCGTDKGLEVPADRQGIQEFAALYRGFAQKNKRGPRNIKELRLKSQGYPNALEMLKSGDLVVKWGLPLLHDGEGDSAVLAYEKNVTKNGGNVLMQDGRTIKKMTADEFGAVSR